MSNSSIPVKPNTPPQVAPAPLFPPEIACFYANMTPGTKLYEDGRFDCPLGFYCPNSTASNPLSTPRICPASAKCGVDRLVGKQCDPQGPFEPLICPQGFYCPDSRTKIVCPAGSFCPLGSYEAQKCAGISNCPEGSYKPVIYDGIVACGVIDLILIILFFVNHALKRKRNAQAHLNSVSPTKVKEDAESVEGPTDLSLLVDSFRRGLNGRQVFMDFNFTDMGLKIDSDKYILNGVSGSIKSSRMTAILGPSGAGKTTFMNVLCGKIPRTSGRLTISGKVAEIHQFKKMIGYVPQDDIMLRELTVRDVLMHAARIRLPHTWTDVEKQNYVDVILKSLNLSHVQHVNIGDETTRGISGGQRKRVNIGIELCAIPTCIFLDEPTSGLDATAALEVCETLRQIAHLGLTIVSVIHQPRVEIFEKFDDIFLIAPGGRTAYIGPCEACQPYFEALGYYFDPRANPADVLMDILSGKARNDKAYYTLDDLVRLWQERTHTTEVQQPDVELEKNHQEFHEVVPILIKERGATFLSQLWYCHYRSIVQQVALINATILEIFVGVLAGLAMGASLQSMDHLYVGLLVEPMTLISPATLDWIIPLMSFLVGTAATLAAAPAAVKVFSEERPVYWRESSSGHSKSAYFLGKNISVLARMLICSLHFATPLHLLSKPIMPFWTMYATIFSLYFGVYGLSSVISMYVDRANAPLLAVIVGLIHSLSAGFGLRVKQAYDNHVGFLFDLAFNRWVSEIFWTENVSPLKHLYLINRSSDFFGFTLDRVWYDFMLVFILSIGWRIAAFISMLLTHRDKQR